MNRITQDFYDKPVRSALIVATTVIILLLMFGFSLQIERFYWIPAWLLLAIANVMLFVLALSRNLQLSENELKIRKAKIDTALAIYAVIVLLRLSPSRFTAGLDVLNLIPELSLPIAFLITTTITWTATFKAAVHATEWRNLVKSKPQPPHLRPSNGPENHF